MPDVKLCTRCLKTKPLSEFHRSRASKDGLQQWCKLCRSKHARQNPRSRNPSVSLYQTAYGLRRKFDISLAEYDEMLEAQGNKCAICGRTPEENGRRLAVDHNHETGGVRGLLCSNCNTAIGFLQDSPEICRLAMLYLHFHQEVTIE